MEVFEGTVRLADDAVALRAVMLVADQRLKVSAREHEIGDWDLSEISARMLEDGCHVSVEGEDLIVSVPEPLRFAEAIGPRVTNPGDGSLRGLGHRGPTAEQLPRLRQQIAELDRRVSRAGWVFAASTVAAISLAVWAPVVLVACVLLGALAGLLIGGFALLDPFVAVRLPDPATPGMLIGAGTLSLGVGLGLAILI